MSDTYAMINGGFILKNEASLFISDLSIQRGFGIFDFFRTVDHKPIFLEDHLDRFYFSASQMNMEISLAREALKKQIFELIEKNSIPDSGIRITLTGGYSEDGYTLSKPNLVITQNAFAFNKENFEKGIKLVTYDHQRQLPQIKTIDYLQAIRLQPFVKENHADDLLYHDQNMIRECPRSNFFIVTNNNEVLTAGKKILKGITRKKILELEEFNIREEEITLKDLENVKEAFVSSTTKNVLPVLKIDGKTIGNGKPGEITRRIYDKICLLKEK